jgi:hypothetical protein
MKAVIALVLSVFAVSCASRRPIGSYQVLPGIPDYLLRSPDARNTSFADTLTDYNGFIPGEGWLDLRPQMGLRIEKAYFRNGAAREPEIKDFVGTEIARYEVRSNGELRLTSKESHLRQRLPGQPGVDELISASQQRFRYHRFFFEVVFKQRGDVRGSVLLGAKSGESLDALAQQLSKDPDAVCEGRSDHCTIFPSGCTVSVEMEIIVNGHSRTVPWGSVLTSVAPAGTEPAVSRDFQGRLTPISLKYDDPNARRLPLLPGDEIRWNED